MKIEGGLMIEGRMLNWMAILKGRDGESKINWGVGEEGRGSEEREGNNGEVLEQMSEEGLQGFIIHREENDRWAKEKV